MNLSKYELSKYDLANGAIGDLEFTMYCEENLGILSHTSLDLPLNFTGVENVKFDSQLTVGLPFNFELSETIMLHARSEVALSVAMNCITELKINSNIIKNISFSDENSEILEISAYISKNIANEMIASEVVSFKSRLAQDINFSQSAFEELLVFSKLTNIDSNISNVNVTLKKGDILKIDTEAFTVTLNDDNIFYKYVGGWHEISRDTLSIDIGNSNNSKMKIKIIYKERFL